ELAANRAAAVKHVRAQQGLTGLHHSEWTYEQRVRYNKALADYILSRPGDFGGPELVAAGAVQAATYLPLEDTSVLANIEAFGAEFGAQGLAAADSIAGVGRGVLNALSSAQWMIPVAVVAVAGIWILKEAKKAKLL